MNMDIREMTEEDRSVVVDWMRILFQKRLGEDAPPPPEPILPHLGLVAADSVTGELLTVAFLYLDQTSPVAVCGWIFANPRNAAKTSARAVDAVIGGLPLFARSRGAEYLLSCFGHPGINRILDRRGFITAEFAEHKIIHL